MVSVLGILPSFSACGAERGRPSITFLCVQVSSRRQLCGLLSGGTRPAPFTPPLKQNDLFACLLARRVGPSATPSVRVWSCVRRSGGSFVILPLSLSLSRSLALPSCFPACACWVGCVGRSWLSYFHGPVFGSATSPIRPMCNPPVLKERSKMHAFLRKKTPWLEGPHRAQQTRATARALHRPQKLRNLQLKLSAGGCHRRRPWTFWIAVQPSPAA